MLTTLLAAALQTCVIVYSPGTNGSVAEKRTHELAHCNGWVHPVRAAPILGGNGYQAFIPPAKYVHPYAGRLVEHKVSLSEARQLCGGHFACQWFE